MTYKETLDLVNKMIIAENCDQPVKTLEFKANIQNALEKQIPKKPIIGSWIPAKCPCCNKYIGEWLEDGYVKNWTNLKVCDCGQKLDWSEDDE